MTTEAAPAQTTTSLAPPPDAGPSIDDVIATVSSARASREAPPAPAPESSAGKAPAAEPGAPPPPSTEPPKDPASLTLERALRAERAATAERAQIKAERAAIEQRAAELAARETKLAADAERARRLEQLVRDDPREFMRLAGADPAAFTKALAAGHRVSPEVREVQAKLEAMERSQREAQQAAEARAQEEATQARATAIQTWSSRVKASAERYGAAAHLVESDASGAERELERAVRSFHEEHGRLPSHEEAAQRVNDQLLGDMRARLSTPWGAEIIRALGYEKPAPASAQAQPAKSAAQQATSGDTGPSNAARTLTGSHATAGGAGIGVDVDSMSDADRLSYAIAQVEAGRSRRP